MNRKKSVTILLCFTLAFIWGNSLLSRQVSGRISDEVMRLMNTAAGEMGLGEDLFTYMYDLDGDGQDEPTSHIVRKMAHVAEFALLGCLLWLRLRGSAGRRSGAAFVLGVLAGGIDETIQIFSHRGSQLQDVAIDAVGVLLGIGAAVLLRAAVRRRGSRRGAQEPRTHSQ